MAEGEEEEGGGGEESQEERDRQREETTQDSGSDDSGFALEDQPQGQGTLVAGTGSQYNRVQSYSGNPSQTFLTSQSTTFGSPTTSNAAKHIHMHAGPNVEDTGAEKGLIIIVNKYVTLQDHITGSITVDTAYDYVTHLEDITPNNPGAPYYGAGAAANTTNTLYNAPVAMLWDDTLGSNTAAFAIANSTQFVLTGNPATEQLAINYENNPGALPDRGFTRKIRVTWSSGANRDFDVLLSGATQLSFGNTNHTGIDHNTRADGCAGDSISIENHTSVSNSTIFHNGTANKGLAYVGFFKEILSASVFPFPGQQYGNSGYVYNSTWDAFRYNDFSYDSNEAPYYFGSNGNINKNVVGEQYYKGITGNLNNQNRIGTIYPVDWIDPSVGGLVGTGPGTTNSYDWARTHLTAPVWSSIPSVLDPSFSAHQFKFGEVHIFSENTSACTPGRPPSVVFDACLDNSSSDYYGYTLEDCSDNDLTNFGGVNYVTNPALATWNNGDCCTDCNNLTLSLNPASTSATNLTTNTAGGTNGCIEVTVLNSSGAQTGLSRYRFVLQALNGQTVGGLGAGAGSAVILGYGYSNVDTFTWGFGVDLAQDSTNTPQNTAIAGTPVLSVTVGGNANILVPASTHNGTFTQGLVAGCYDLFVYDESVDFSGEVTPCFDSIRVCIADGVGVIGCTDNTASTNFGVALNYNSLAVVDDGTCAYCHSSGTLIDANGTVIPTAGEIATAGVNSFSATPTLTTTSNDGSVILQNISPTLAFNTYVNDIVNSAGLVNVDYTLELFKASSMTDWDNAVSSTSSNDLTNFASQASATNNQNMGWGYHFTTTSLGANINYGYYAVKVAVSDPDAVVEIEQCFQVFYFIIPIEVCVDTSNSFATALTNTNSPPGTLVISDPRLWHSNPSLCYTMNNFCCDAPVITNPSGTCAINEIHLSIHCSPVSSLFSAVLEHFNGSVWIPGSSWTSQVNQSNGNWQVTITQGSNSFIADGLYRIALTSQYLNAADCTVYSNQLQITSAVYGCTDSTALNYDPLATCDDNSCVYCVYGCMDALALNFDPAATCDDGSCISPIYGCTDATAYNYNVLANVDDGSCLYGVLGCTDTSAYNFNKNCTQQTVVATIDDGCCFYPCDPINQGASSSEVVVNATGDCGGSNSDGSVVVTTSFSTGAMSGQSKTISFYTNAGVLIYTDPITHNIASSSPTWTYSSLASGVYYYVITDNYGCAETISFSVGSSGTNCGCTDPNAPNYDASATTDDGSCLYGGCIDPNALNYNPNAAYDDGSCTYPPVISPCVPANTNSLIRLLQACISKNGSQFYNKLITGQADDCSIMNVWKVILIEYLVSKRGNNCIYNCADSGTGPVANINSCEAKWKQGGPTTGGKNVTLPGSTNANGGTEVTDPALFFNVEVDLYTGDIIKMPSGIIYEVVPPTTSCSYGCFNPETSTGANSGHWQQCVPGLQITSFDNNINYLDKFNTFVTKFCVDCNVIEDSSNTQYVNQSKSNRSNNNNTGISGISGLET